MAEISARDIEKNILDNFANVAGSIGYSDVHGKIIGVLLVENRPMSLQGLSKEVGYSSGMVSVSLDFLELLGVLKKVKKSGDRKLYVQFQGDLLSCLRKAVLMKLEKTIVQSQIEFEQSRNALKGVKNGDKEKVLRTLNVLEKEIKRLNKYASALSEIRLP